MIIIYKRGNWDWVRIEDVKAIAIVKLEDMEKYEEKLIDACREISYELEKINVILKDVGFGKISRAADLLSLAKSARKIGYEYVIFVDTPWASYNFFVKRKGNEEEINKIFSDKKVKLIEISEENGVEKVETE